MGESNQPLISIDNLEKNFEESKPSYNAQEAMDESHVEFEKKGEKDDKETLHLMNPNSRKYFSSLIFKQHQQGSEIGRFSFFLKK